MDNVKCRKSSEEFSGYQKRESGCDKFIPERSRSIKTRNHETHERKHQEHQANILHKLLINPIVRLWQAFFSCVWISTWFSEILSRTAVSTVDQRNQLTI
jgi:hypothetical protein